MQRVTIQKWNYRPNTDDQSQPQITRSAPPFLGVLFDILLRLAIFFIFWQLLLCLDTLVLHHRGYLSVLNSRNLTYLFSPILFHPLLGTDFRLSALRGFRLDWIWCALTIAAIRPGKRRSISVHREVLCISTPLRSPRISPASRRTLKCCESVDFGIPFSVTFKKFEQLREHSDPTISEKMATRIGSLSA